MGDKLGFIELMYTYGLQLIQLYVPIFAYYMFQLLWIIIISHLVSIFDSLCIIAFIVTRSYK